MFNTKQTIKVNGMKCEHCKKRVQAALSSIEGITSTNINLKTGIVKIKSPKEIPFSTLEKVIQEAGYEIEK